MSFTWPLALLFLVAVPLLLGIYLWQLRRRRRQAVRFSSVALVRAAMVKRSAWRRHLPVGLFLAGLAGLGLAAARPQVAVGVPLSRTSIILTLDVSRSMCSTDVEPNRLAVAQEAARTFIENRASGTRIGIVAFSGIAEQIVAPTTDKKILLQAIDGLTTGRGTVIGAATLKAIEAIAAVNPNVKPIGNVDLNASSQGGSSSAPVEPAKGPFQPDIVVLLTDGANTRGVLPVDAAKLAAERGVRVYTIGFGTTNPTSMVCTASQLGGDAIGGDGFRGGAFPGGFGGANAGGGLRQFLVIDESTLTKVATITGGEFYRAQDAQQLRKVFEDLPNQVVLQKRNRELSMGFAAFGAVAAMAAMTLSLLWNRYP